MSRLAEQECGAPTAGACRKPAVSSDTFYKWKPKYSGLDVSFAGRLKPMEMAQWHAIGGE
jgi:putative transposase